MKNKLDNEYVKNIENRNTDLDEKNCKLEGENERIKAEIKMVREACLEFESCLSILLEKYGSDKEIYNLIYKTLNSTSKKLLKQKV